MTLTPGSSIGRYLVQRKLAEGGMAEVYLCSSTGPEGFEKEVAIKRIRSTFATDPGFVQMFIAEARLASRLNHLHLVQIFDFGQHEDTYYLAMEYVRGHSLADVRRQSKALMLPMPPTLAAHVCSKVASGLHHAHHATDREGKPLGLVHRDVTPHNVLVSYDGAIKLTDFGIAKAGEGLTAPGMLKGKFAYMSPEQSRGEGLDARSDVFSLGVVLWELITGARLFEGDSDLAVLRAVQQSAIPPPARINSEVSAELDEICMRALQRDRSLRTSSAQELERALAQHVVSTARSVDDTDLGGYLRRLFAPEAAAPAVEAVIPSPPPNAPETYEKTAPSPRPRGEASFHQAPLVAGERPPSFPAVSPRSDTAAWPQRLVDAATVTTERGPAPRTGMPPTVGMRRGTAVALALFVVVSASAVALSLRARARRELPAPAAQTTGLAAAADAGPALSLVRTGEAADAGPPLEAVAVAVSADAGPQAPSAVVVGDRARVTRVARPPASRPGMLRVRAIGWAELSIDGKDHGEIREVFREIPLAAGKHRLLFRFLDLRERRTITIASDQTVTAEFRPPVPDAGQ